MDIGREEENKGSPVKQIGNDAPRPDFKKPEPPGKQSVPEFPGEKFIVDGNGLQQTQQHKVPARSMPDSKKHPGNEYSIHGGLNSPFPSFKYNLPENIIA